MGIFFVGFISEPLFYPPALEKLNFQIFVLERCYFLFLIVSYSRLLLCTKCWPCCMIGYLKQFGGFT
jgi:hypothetical protein